MSRQAATRTTPDAIITEIQIAAPPERVFEALVDPARVVEWWGQPGVYRCTEFHSDLRVGGSMRLIGLDAESKRFEIVGEYLEIEAPRLLVYTWMATWTRDVKTSVRWELQARDGGTLVTVRHGGFAAHPELTQSYAGWPRMLGWLQALLERGETVEDRKPVSAS